MDAPRAPKRSKARLRAAAVVGVPLSLALASSAFFQWNLRGPGALLTPRFSAHHFFHGLSGQLPWLLPFVGLAVLTLVLRAIQWQQTLPVPVPFTERYHLVAMGAFVNSALPGNLGDVTRAFLMARRQKLPFLKGLGTVAVCKLFEFVALMTLVGLCIAGPLGARMGHLAGTLHVAMGLCGLLLVLVVLLARSAPAFARKLEKSQRMPRLRRILHELEGGLASVRSLRGMTRAFGFSLLPVLSNALAYGLGLRGLGLRGGLFAGPLVLGALSLGQSVMLVPAGTGIYYLVASWAARSLGATADQAAAYAALTHLGTVATQVVLGAVSLAVRRIRWRDLRRGSQEAADAELGADEGFDAERG